MHSKLAIRLANRNSWDDTSKAGRRFKRQHERGGLHVTAPGSGSLDGAINEDEGERRFNKAK